VKIFSSKNKKARASFQGAERGKTTQHAYQTSQWFKVLMYTDYTFLLQFCI